MKKSAILVVLTCFLSGIVLDSCSSHQCPAYSSVYKAKAVKSKGKKKDRFKD
ncbi:hypothetical protein [Solitalea longa]|uniref:hypothetical protein n=1 Tax=Solitalea longa TaxID=2079460 RepID=UPI0013FD5537|nr:hypothetical protein [Solitalea longa]